MHLNGNAVKQRLRDRDLTVAWLARRTDINRPTLHKYIVGALTCPEAAFDAIIDALDVEDPMVFVGPPDREGSLVATGRALGLTPERYAELYETAAA